MKLYIYDRIHEYEDIDIQAVANIFIIQPQFVIFHYA